MARRHLWRRACSATSGTTPRTTASSRSAQSISRQQRWRNQLRTIPTGVVSTPRVQPPITSVEYRNPQSGALVFGAGTRLLPMGPFRQHDNSPSPFSASTPDANVQQATVNVLADMGVQPQTLQSGLVAATQSTDTTPPTTTISSVSPNNVVEGGSVTVSGTANDTGGVIGGVQVSTDGGKTWHPANSPVGAASENWTYTFSAPAPGTYTVQSRAVDDSANLGSPSSGVSYTVTPSSALSLFSPSATPPNAQRRNCGGGRR